MDKQIYTAPNATIVGDVVLGNGVSIWYGAVLRGDSGRITVGNGSNIQDNCVLHDETTIGSCCTIGHGAIIHGCTIGDGCTIGMGSVILSGAILGDNCLVGAGALVTGKTKAPAGSLLLGSPAKVVRQLTPEEIQEQKNRARQYQEKGKAAFGSK